MGFFFSGGGGSAERERRRRGERRGKTEWVGVLIEGERDTYAAVLCVLIIMFVYNFVNSNKDQHGKEKKAKNL